MSGAGTPYTGRPGSAQTLRHQKEDMKRIAYGKLGRTLEIDPAKWGQLGGDNEAPTMLVELAERNPDVTWVCMSKNRGWTPPLPNIENPWQGFGHELKDSTLYGNKGNDDFAAYYKTIALLDELTFPIYREVDGIVNWLGQHGSASSPVPKVGNREEIAKAQISGVYYTSHIVRGINVWRREDPIAREEVWLQADVRNYLKCRDLKNPRRHPILGQYEFERKEKMERYGDPRTPAELGFEAEVGDGVWKATDRYIYSGLELTSLSNPAHYRENWLEWEDRVRFGYLANEALTKGVKPELNRIDAVRDYVKPLDPDWAHGRWTDEGLAAVGMDIQPMHYNSIFERLSSTKSTFTTPTSGSRWPTLKTWEAFASGTIMFMHPNYDSQGHLLPTLAQVGEGAGDSEIASLALWLRVENPAQLRARVNAVNSDKATYEWLRDAQYRHLVARKEENRCIKMIEERLGL